MRKTLRNAHSHPEDLLGRALEAAERWATQSGWVPLTFT